MEGNEDEGLRIGFSKDSLEAEYVGSKFSFKTSIPLANCAPADALDELAEKIFEMEIPYSPNNEIPAPNRTQTQLSPLEKNYLSLYLNARLEI